MARHDHAGKPARAEDLVDVDALLTAYHERTPDLDDPGQRVAFGTSGHRGSALDTAFNDAHVAAMTQAVVDHRTREGIDGPLYLGRDTHALSAPAHDTAVEVLVANGVQVHVDDRDGYTPTPSISHAILTANAGDGPRADGIVITPSHNPPADGGFKYNPPSGGPAAAEATSWIEERANELLAGGNADVQRTPLDEAVEAPNLTRYDLLGSYVDDLGAALDMDAIREAGVRIGVDPMGGAAVDYWAEVGERYGLDLTVVNPEVDPQFAFMTLDADGQIRMDCSSPDAMASLIALRDEYDVAFGNDADADRHGIVTPAGLMNPNHYLAVAIDYLLGNRPQWGQDVGIGKTLVSSSIIDRVVADHDRRLVEVPVGFKWFVDGLLDGSLGFGGEESAGASFLRHDGSTWTTDKDGILLCLLAAEICATTGRDPSQHHDDLTERFGAPVYRRIDAPATREQKATLKDLSPEQVEGDTLAGDPIVDRMTRAPGNDAAIGGLKVTTEQGWFAARPSGTEDIYKVYAESFRGEDHLDDLVDEAKALVESVIG